MVMLGSADNASQWGRQVAQPDEIGMRETQSPCVIVADTDAHYARAKDAGATIVMDIADQDYGGAGHSCRQNGSATCGERGGPCVWLWVGGRRVKQNKNNIANDSISPQNYT